HSGSYQFRYTISDNCNNTDEAVLNIFIKPIPETPQISVNPVVCTNAPLELFASTITAGTYQWSGPNGFISTEQNPVIENPTSLDDGVYTLKILLNGCESEMVSTAVNVKDYPNLMIAGGCENN